MPDEHEHLFGRDEALEVVPWLVGLERLYLGRRALPDDAGGHGEQVLHEARLAGELHVHRAVSQTRRPAGELILGVLLHGTHGILQRHELDVGVHGLAGDPLHDDVDGFFRVVQDLGVAAEKCNHLGTLGVKWDLQQSVKMSHQMKSKHFLSP